MSPRALLASAFAALSLAACYGSLTLDFGGSADTRPTVSLTASADTVTQAGPLTLIAAATDDHGVTSVEFYQLDPIGQPLRLGAVSAPPYRWTLQLTRADNGIAYFFARAIDTAGQTADSGTVSVTISIP